MEGQGEEKKSQGPAKATEAVVAAENSTTTFLHLQIFGHAIGRWDTAATTDTLVVTPAVKVGIRNGTPNGKCQASSSTYLPCPGA